MSEPKRRTPIHALRDTEGATGTDPFEKIVSELRALMAAEFERGAADAASRILQVVAMGDIRDQTAASRPGAVIKRAPHGAARALVADALVKGPMTIQEIRETARTPVEKFLSYQTIRLELLRGQKSKKYKKTKDKWSCV